MLPPMLLALVTATFGAATPLDCPHHALLASLYGPAHSANAQDAPDSKPQAAHPRELHLANVHQLTFGGQNAEAYWNVEGTEITYQARQEGYPDEQIFRMKADGSAKTLVSTGKGRCTCSYFSPDSRSIFFSSTHEKNEGAQPAVDMSQGYVWRVNPQFSLFRRDLATNALTRIIEKDAYVAETTIDPAGRYMVFTGTFDGDLEIYRANLDGTNIQRLTHEVGYDGGPFVSWDGQKIVYRRDTLETEAEVNDYKRLLAMDLVRPGKLDIWIMNADGTGQQQVTRLAGASFAPFLHPNGEQIIFSSNFHDPRGREFDLFVVNTDGTGLRQVTFTPEFDGFPMFSKNGKKLLWASNRHGSVEGETNIFVADWVEEPPVESVIVEASNDVWVYEFASNQDQDSFLRVWGSGLPVAAFGEAPDDSVSLVEFPKTTLPAGEIVSARLVLTHAAPTGSQREHLRTHPVELFSVAPGIDEKRWVKDLAIDHWPAGSALARGVVMEDGPEGAFHVAFDVTNDMKEWRTNFSEKGLAFALFSSLPVGDLGRDAIYKFFSRNAADPTVRPRLEIVVRK
jgi:TolB protein